MTQEKISEYFSDEKNLFMVWNENDTFPGDEHYFPVDYLSLCISLSGSIDFFADTHHRHADKDHIQFFVKDLSVKIVNRSPDYKSVGILFSSRFWQNTLIHAHPFTVVAFIQSTLEVSPEKKEVILDFFNLIYEAKQCGKSDDNIVLQHLMLGLFYQIGKMYEEWFCAFPKRSNQNVITEFVRLLYDNYKQHRDVAFYADKLNLSKARFSEIMRMATGMSAFRCIERYVIFKASSQLINTTKSIKEIALDMNFDDTSHFCKYFKKYAGLSPEAFRKKAVLIRDSKWPQPVKD